MTWKSFIETMWREPDGPQLIDGRGALRDTFLAGGYAAVTTGVVLKSWKAAAVGFAGGGFLGTVLHLVPRAFERGNRPSRVVLRALSGAVAGAGSGSTVQTAWLRDDDPEKVRRSMLLGAVSGAAFYALWGLIEPKASVHADSRRERAEREATLDIVAANGSLPRKRAHADHPHDH